MDGPIAPGFSKRDSRDLCENVDAQGWHANLKRDPRLSEIGFRKAGQGRAKILKRSQNLSSVMRGWFDPNVEVAGRSRIYIEVNGVGSNDNEACVSFGQRAYDVEKVGRHPNSSISTAPRL